MDTVVGVPTGLTDLAGTGDYMVSKFFLNNLTNGWNLGSQIQMGQNQRTLYRAQRDEYAKQLADWNKNVGSKGRSIKYPNLSYSGNILSRDIDIENSYLNSGIKSGSAMSKLVKWM